MENVEEVIALRQALADTQTLLDTANEELINIKQQLLLLQSSRNDLAPVQSLLPHPDKSPSGASPIFQIPGDHGKIYSSTSDKTRFSKLEEESMEVLRRLRSGKMEDVDSKSRWPLSIISNLVPDAGKYALPRGLARNPQQIITEKEQPSIRPTNKSRAADLEEREIEEAAQVGSIEESRTLWQVQPSGLDSSTPWHLHRPANQTSTDYRRHPTSQALAQSLPQVHILANPSMPVMPSRADTGTDPHPAKRHKQSHSKAAGPYASHDNHTQHQINRSICTDCWREGTSCDSRPRCRSCERAGRTCVRVRCRYGDGCRSSSCELLHPRDWNSSDRAWNGT